MMSPAGLVGRDQESAALDRMLTEVRDGASRSPVIRGDPGIGKSALPDYVTAAGGGVLVIPVSGPT